MPHKDDNNADLRMCVQFVQEVQNSHKFTILDKYGFDIIYG